MSVDVEENPRRKTRRVFNQRFYLLVGLCTALVTLAYNIYWAPLYDHASRSHAQHVPRNAQEILDQCAALEAIPGPPANFLAREESDRFELGTNSTLIRNASIWTGAQDGNEVVHGDVLLEKGIVKAIGDIPDYLVSNAHNLTIVDAAGAWITPGLVDLHSHVGLLSAPLLAGAFDLNSPNGPVLPWLRSIDGFNTHDDAFELAMSGGVTSVQVLPGSGNAIGGQAFMIKLRKTSEKSPSSMILEPPHSLNGTNSDSGAPLRWRHLKQACGENLQRYGNRMDSIWAFRSAYNEARKIKNAQDAYCQKAQAGAWDSVQGNFPENLQWEMLVDVLRGRVKISNHCYEAVDLDGIVRLTNEFRFHVASFHHASEAWLVPDVLKRTWGGPPAVAIFASNHRYKRESYRGSEFAPRVLADNDIAVVMKSDHPVINSRYLLFEAQQAHHYGLPLNLALSSVTAVPATAAGLSHRIGILREGVDADVVLWDSHPLRLGATPVKVWIDGIVQIPVPPKSDEQKLPIVVGKGKEEPLWREAPDAPNWDQEREEAVKWEGLPPLQTAKENGKVIFRNVREVWTRSDGGSLVEMFSADSNLYDTVVIVEGGKITCAGNIAACTTDGGDNFEAFVNLHGGSISPGLMTVGSPVGIEEIAAEPSTGDGKLFDIDSIPNVLGDVGGVVRAADALQFQTRNALIAHRSGVTSATSSLGKVTLFGGTSSIISGLSVTFRTGSAHALEEGAIIKDITALHMRIGRPHPLSGWLGKGSSPSVSTEIAILRRLLSFKESTNTETGYWFTKAAEGVVPLVIEVASADVMASLLKIKKDVEEERGTVIRMVFEGATEAHLLAEELGKAKVGVILSPSRPFPNVWDERRILAGPPLTNDTALSKLVEHGVTVGLGVREAWDARNARFDLAWAALETNGLLDRRSAYALASTNLEKLLGVKIERGMVDLVAYDGGSAFDMSSKVVAVISPERKVVDLI